MVQQVGKLIYEKRHPFKMRNESQNGKRNALYHCLINDIVIEYISKLHMQCFTLLFFIRLLTF